MKHISDVINPRLTETPKASGSAPNDCAVSKTQAGAPKSLKASSPEYREAVVSRLWTRMTEIYGHKWTTNYGTPADGAFDTWTKALADLTSEQIAQGVRRCMSRADEWPPTLPAFRQLCLDASTHATNAAAYRRNTDVLGAPGTKRLTDQRSADTRRDHARPFLQTLKAAVGRKDGDA